MKRPPPASRKRGDRMPECASRLAARRAVCWNVVHKSSSTLCSPLCSPAGDAASPASKRHRFTAPPQEEGGLVGLPARKPFGISTYKGLTFLARSCARLFPQRSPRALDARRHIADKAAHHNVLQIVQLAHQHAAFPPRLPVPARITSPTGTPLAARSSRQHREERSHPRLKTSMACACSGTSRCSTTGPTSPSSSCRVSGDMKICDARLLRHSLTANGRCGDCEGLGSGWLTCAT